MPDQIGAIYPVVRLPLGLSGCLLAAINRGYPRIYNRILVMAKHYITAVQSRFLKLDSRAGLCANTCSDNFIEQRGVKMKSAMNCPHEWCENTADNHTGHWSREEVTGAHGMTVALYAWMEPDRSEVLMNVTREDGEGEEVALTIDQAVALRTKLDRTLALLGSMHGLEFPEPCGHRCCTLTADFAVWVSHHAVECRPDTGFRCSQHAEELRTHWWAGLGGEMRCGCTVDGVLEDHYRRVAL